MRTRMLAAADDYLQEFMQSVIAAADLRVALTNETRPPESELEELVKRLQTSVARLFLLVVRIGLLFGLSSVTLNNATDAAEKIADAGRAYRDWREKGPATVSPP